METDRPPQSASPSAASEQEARESLPKLFHDARGCLNGMQLNLTLLRRSVAGELDHLADLKDRNQAWVQAISEEIGRLQEIIEQAAEASASSSEDLSS